MNFDERLEVNNLLENKGFTSQGITPTRLLRFNRVVENCYSEINFLSEQNPIIVKVKEKDKVYTYTAASFGELKRMLERIS
jgi:hypothetical protein